VNVAARLKSLAEPGGIHKRAEDIGGCYRLRARMAFIVIHRATATSTTAPITSTVYAVVWVMPVVSSSLPCKY
jgi:hypothetical protein